ncbi:hypothetical protein RJ640_017840 [Escallonia rubra]|uniref:F-box domain-containing protein n=1 Tax=Escallonia rubra TaxID=112253 RepID=A0AA88REP8_9ASTE|nr:hypothetical protein RJ640_017840 [Escallonia rubra]
MSHPLMLASGDDSGDRTEPASICTFCSVSHIRLEMEMIEFLFAHLPELEVMFIQHERGIDANAALVMAIAGNGNSEAIKSAKADIISNLPRDIIANILKRMPIQYVVRTSMLSRKWRYNWSTIPGLEFGRQFFENFDSVSIISKLLLLHSGPILKFVIQIPSKISFTEREVIDINQWILFLSRNGLEELTFEYSPGRSGEHYKLPSHLFSCLQLTHLKLRTCSLFPSVKFEGFPNLIYLELRSVVLAPDLFRGFFSRCPRLERLVVKIFDASDELYIENTPNLRHLHVSGNLGSINIENAQGLTTLTISSDRTLENLERSSSSNMIQLLGHLPNLEKLSLNYFLLKAYRNDHSAVSDPGIEFWEEKCTMGQLRTVKFTAVEGLTTELKFIKYILACSPLLEKVYVEREEVADASAGLMTGFMISKELMRFRRASPKAEVMYSDPSEAKLA